MIEMHQRSNQFIKPIKQPDNASSNTKLLVTVNSKQTKRGNKMRHIPQMFMNNMFTLWFTGKDIEERVQKYI